MSDKANSVADVALDVKPAATLNPIQEPAQTCRELAERWAKLQKLSPEEGQAFADDLEIGRIRFQSQSGLL